MAVYSYLCFNNQLDFEDCSVPCQFVYAAPEGFDEGRPEDALTFLRWEYGAYDNGDFEEENIEVQFWDGRTMVVGVSDSMGVSILTYIFEEKDPK